MSRETLIIVLALLTALSPFVGLPYPYLMVVLPVLGLIIAASALVLRIRRMPEVPLHEEGSA